MILTSWTSVRDRYFILLTKVLNPLKGEVSKGNSYAKKRSGREQDI